MCKLEAEIRANFRLLKVTLKWQNQWRTIPFIVQTISADLSILFFNICQCYNPFFFAADGEAEVLRHRQVFSGESDVLE